MPQVKRWLADPAIADGLNLEPGSGPGPREELFGVFLPKGRLIGAVRLHRLDHKANQGSFGVFIGDRRLWGKGLGTEASRQAVQLLFARGAARVRIAVLSNNDRALATYRKIGFQVVGVVPGCVSRPRGLLNTVILQAGPDEVARAAGQGAQLSTNT